MNGMPDNSDDALLRQVRTRRRRDEEWRREGRPSMARYVGQIGVLGWMIVAPALIGLFIGRALDHRFASGIFWSAPLLMIGVAIGCWSAWRWMHAR